MGLSHAPPDALSFCAAAPVTAVATCASQDCPTCGSRARMARMNSRSPNYAAIKRKPPEIGAARTIPRSMNALIVAYYGSADFKGLKPSTARVYRNILERFREVHGDKDAAGMQPINVRRLMEEKCATPDAANRLLNLISILMEHAIRQGWRDDNPAVGIKRLKHQGTASRHGLRRTLRHIAPITRSAPASGLSSSWRSAPRSGAGILSALAGGTLLKARSRSSKTRRAQRSPSRLSRSFAPRSIYAPGTA